MARSASSTVYSGSSSSMSTAGGWARSSASGSRGQPAWPLVAVAAGPSATSTATASPSTAAGGWPATSAATGSTEVETCWPASPAAARSMAAW